MNKTSSIRSVAAVMLVVCLIAVLLLVSGCSEVSERADGQTPEPVSYEGKKILFINSYHEGDREEIETAITETLAGTGVELKFHYMDTKANPDEAFKKQAGLDARAVVEKWNPDVVIPCDDNAFKYLVMPYYKDADLPFVHCGINWDSSVYGAPYRNTTGMIEVALLEQLVEELMNYADGDRVGFLAVDNTTGQKTGAYFSKALEGVTIRYVSSFSEWKDAFVDMQETLDMLVIGNLRGLDVLDDNEAREFVHQNIRIPTGAAHEPEMPYAVIGFIISSEEQGEWVAQTALRILDGTNPSAIPEVTNKEAKILVNLDLAEQLDIIFPSSILKIAEVYETDENH